MNIKVPFYHIVNMFLTGLVFMGGFMLLLPAVSNILLNNPVVLKLNNTPDIIEIVFVFACAYEVGIIINRFGSVLIEPLFKKWKLIPFDDNYNKYNEKKKAFPILDTLSREYALSRTGVTLFLFLTIIALFSQYKLSSVLFLLILILYFFSCRKHAGKIVALMHSA